MEISWWRKACRLLAYVIFTLDLISLLGFIIIRILKSASEKDVLLEWTKLENPELTHNELVTKANAEWSYMYAYATYVFLDLLAVGVLFRATAQGEEPRKALLYTRIWLVLYLILTIIHFTVDAMLNEFSVMYFFYLIDVFIIIVVSGYFRQLYQTRDKTSELP